MDKQPIQIPEWARKASLSSSSLLEAANQLTIAMNWCDTPEGWEVWDLVYRRLRQLAKIADAIEKEQRK